MTCEAHRLGDQNGIDSDVPRAVAELLRGGNVFAYLWIYSANLGRILRKTQTCISSFRHMQASMRTSHKTGRLGSGSNRGLNMASHKFKRCAPSLSDGRMSEYKYRRSKAMWLVAGVRAECSNMSCAPTKIAQVIARSHRRQMRMMLRFTSAIR